MKKQDPSILWAFVTEVCCLLVILTVGACVFDSSGVPVALLAARYGVGVDAISRAGLTATLIALQLFESFPSEFLAWLELVRADLAKTIGGGTWLRL